MGEGDPVPTPATAERGDGTPRPRARRVLSILATIVALAVVASLAALLVSARGANGSGIGSGIGSGTDAGEAFVSTLGWQTYHDPMGLFSIQVPPEWRVQSDTSGSGSFGDRTGTYSYTLEGVWLGVPPENVNGFGVWVSVTPLTTDFARGWTCRNQQGHLSTNTTLGGIPASYDGGSMWLLDAHDAHFQVNAHYPGGPESPNPGGPIILTPPPTATPMPSGQTELDRQIMATVLASFTLTHPVPLQCS